MAGDRLVHTGLQVKPAVLVGLNPAASSTAPLPNGKDSRSGALLLSANGSSAVAQEKVVPKVVLVGTAARADRNGGGGGESTENLSSNSAEKAKLVRNNIAMITATPIVTG